MASRATFERTAGPKLRLLVSSLAHSDAHQFNGGPWRAWGAGQSPGHQPAPGHLQGLQPKPATPLGHQQMESSRAKKVCKVINFLAPPLCL